MSVAQQALSLFAADRGYMTDVAVESFTLSKSYNMAGWRVGFFVGNKQIIQALQKLKSWLDYGTFTPIQVAATVALNSNQQCGRLSLIEIDFCDSLDKFLEKYPNAKVCDFGGKLIDSYFEVGVVGCEGGFSDRERKLFKDTISFDTSLILRSESAVVSLASKVLL